MFTSLLVAIDGSDLAEKALDAAIGLAKAQKSPLLIVTATDPVGSGYGSGGFGTIDAGPILAKLDESYAQAAQTLLASAHIRAETAGIATQTLHVPHQRPAEAILSTAVDRGIDTIVMGSHGRRGLARLLLGSQAAEVLARSPIPVLIVK
ncbi:universal stress protein [Devosia chinhatensis]|uniref:UspA domain-containing protein n=1 Tax=Devosia chinhatensis TaxID=429727 RepID=A0A0F5FFT2_9HYPH|nr:universal stress protein [Devosia chinhatensis]KKB07759.1 hypothetical protein VE26_13955 [Devosia chinhatensis]